MSKRDPASKQGAPPGPSVNRVLACLPGALLARWWPQFQVVSLSPHQMLDARTTSEHVFFPLDCVLSLQCALADGAASHIAFVGREGFVGVAALAGGHPTFLHMVTAQGHALRLPTASLAAELERGDSPILQSLVTRQLHSLLVQAAQRAVCSRHHSPQAQLATLLLLASGRSGLVLDLTHDTLSGMLGMRRETVSHAAYRMQQDGLLRYRRGHMAILDESRLRPLACECYRTLADERTRLLPEQPQPGESTP
jgi:CRP-like cAMP-binding protein